MLGCPESVAEAIAGGGLEEAAEGAIEIVARAFARTL